MLTRKRVDIGVFPRVNGLYHIKRLNIGGIRELRPSLMKFDLFHYLHQKHKELVPRISAVFRKMRKSGELTAIRRHVVAVLMELAGKNLKPCDDDYACFEKAQP